MGKKRRATIDRSGGSSQEETRIEDPLAYEYQLEEEERRLREETKRLLDQKKSLEEERERLEEERERLEEEYRRLKRENDILREIVESLDRREQESCQINLDGQKEPLENLEELNHETNMNRENSPLLPS